MKMYISPRHLSFSLPDKPFEEWETEFLIELFQARTDGWHLEVADRCINGWKNEKGEESIDTRHLDGRPANYIPDSGWAVLQITLNYFETIAFFKNGAEIGKSYERFTWGVFDVFPEFMGQKPNIARHLYSDLRSGLYHGGINKGKTILRHTIDSKPIEADEKTGVIIVDPHRFIPKLRQHLNAYCAELMDKNNVEIRHKFRAAFFAKYG